MGARIKPATVKVTIRQARAEDAERLLAHIAALSQEPGINIGLAPGEFELSVEAERRLLTSYALMDNSVFLIAEAGGQLVGTLKCQGGMRKMNRHTTTLGMTVRQGWRNRSIGSQLMARALQWAQETGLIRRIELIVYARNAPAIHLYEKFGFQVEGCRRRAIFADGEFLDDLIMARLL